MNMRSFSHSLEAQLTHVISHYYPNQYKVNPIEKILIMREFKQWCATQEEHTLQISVSVDHCLVSSLKS